MTPDTSEQVLDASRQAASSVTAGSVSSSSVLTREETPSQLEEQQEWTTLSAPTTCYDVLKRTADILLATMLLIVCIPVWLLIGLAIIMDSGRPHLFRQERVGKNGRRFIMYKFRTLSADYPRAADKPRPGDVRVTRVGKWLRNTGLDELPQLLNILRGEMSFVGPRPEMVHVVEHYTPEMMVRLSVAPGLTGIWQIYGDHDRPIHEQLEWDLRYIERHSLLLDVWLVAITPFLPILSLFRRWNH